jgi:glycosyltransferase involved in cell wall biosynthesis
MPPPDRSTMPPDAPSTARPWLLVSAAFVKTGGQDRANFALASFLARRGDKVHLVSHRVAGDVGPAGRVVTHTAPRPLQSDLLGEPFLQWMGSRWARRLRPQSARVIANGGNCAWPDVNWVHYVHAAYDRTGEGSVVRQARMFVSHHRWLHDERKALRHARVVVANSKRTRQDLVDRVGVRPERIRVVYYGIDNEQFRPPMPGDRAATRKALGWPANRPVALFIGALGDRRKGFDTLYRAWQSLESRGSDTPLLAVIGTGALLPEFRRRAAEEGLDKHIAFLGFREDVPALVRAADLLVAATRYEAYGLGVHEALCCGLPAIVSAAAGVAERYPPELAHLLLPDAEDAADLAARVERCLASPSETAAAMTRFSASLRSRTWDDMARDIVAAVDEP